MFTWLNGSDHHPPIFLHFRSSKVFIIASVAAAVFTDLFLYGVIVPVIPFALSSRAGVDESQVQRWTSVLLAVYGAALLVGSPICGWWADRTTSRKGPLLIGLLALAGATGILTAGNSIAVLVVGRLLQGASAAVVWVVGLALVADTVGPAEVGNAMGYIGVAMSFGVLLSPLIGGVVFERAGYFAVFGVSFALLGMDIVLRFALIERKIAMKWLSKDEMGDGPERAEQNALELQTATDDLKRPTDLPSSGPKDPPTNHDSSSTDIDPTLITKRLPTFLLLLQSRRLLSACLGCLVQAILLTSYDSTLPLFVRNTFTWNATGAGLIFLPVTIPAFFAPFIGRLSDRYGPRHLATAGFLLGAPCIILQRLVESNTLRQKVLLCALLALLGVALNLVLTPLMAEITYSVEATVRKRPRGFFGDKGAYAQAYGLFNMAFAAGSMIGPLVGGLVVESKGWGAATLVLGVLSGVFAGPTFWWTGGSWGRERKRRGERGETGPKGV
ncbi:major facilitator superfamily domain-containing protein [Elsinoe ampelina]|uniref:Major facilitator superfamily domain-containing protein n=1 Tax=Elsinoe ampelina TaxID=302913 RepID=A0A6A6GA56_9PEZI|nr:major facilitator superfamily domain-containing protein [Elsinoe ampelina]